MEMKTVLRKVIDTLNHQKNTRLVGSMLAKSLELHPKDYHEFSRLNKMLVQETTLDSILSAVENCKTEELNDDAKISLNGLHKLRQRSGRIDARSEELRLLLAFRDIEIEEDYVKYDDPTDILSTVLKMSFPIPVLHRFLRHQIGLRGEHDYEELKRFFGPLHGALRESLGERFRDVLYRCVFGLSRLYGVPPIKKLKPEDFYIGGYPFYMRHQGEPTITFSTSSGLPNPLERYGTDEFVRRYSIPPDNAGDLLLKNPYRSDNFSKGILNKRMNCRRTYIWEKKGTSEALKEALTKVPENKKQAFLDDATKSLTEALMIEKIRIIEIEEFDGWMNRFTRNARDEIMFSLRGTESKRISEAIHIGFGMEAMQQRRRFIQRILKILPIGMLAHPAVGIAIVLLVAGEDVAYSLVESTLKKPFTVEDEILRIGRLLKDYGKQDRKEAQTRSERIIQELQNDVE